MITEIIEAILKNKNISKKKLAEMVGMKQSTIYRKFKKQSFNEDDCALILKALGASFIYGYEDNETKERVIKTRLY